MAASHVKNISSGTPVPVTIAVRIFPTSPCGTHALRQVWGGGYGDVVLEGTLGECGIDVQVLYADSERYAWLSNVACPLPSMLLGGVWEVGRGLLGDGHARHNGRWVAHVSK